LRDEPARFGGCALAPIISAPSCGVSRESSKQRE
jgi:hypothetical protein